MELEPLSKENRDLEENFIVSKESGANKNERGRWGSRMEFLLAIIGFTVGVGSIWRFPILCARNGGGAFLIPFFFFMITCGGPLYYLEVSLGQFSGQSAGASFEFCPLLRGIGFLMVFISFDILWYYVTIMGWIQYYFVQSFNSELPWSTCGNWWNTQTCKEGSFLSTSESPNNSVEMNVTSVPFNISTNATSASVFTSPANEFWLYNVLRKSDGLEDMGSVQWHLVLSNFVGWAIVVASLIKGVKSLGKVVYITATAPYVLLTILLIRGLLLDGAMDGVLWYITPDFEKLASPQWLDTVKRMRREGGWDDTKPVVFFSTINGYHHFRRRPATGSRLVCLRDNRNPVYTDAVLVLDETEPVGRVPQQICTVISENLNTILTRVSVIFTGHMIHDGPRRGGGPKLTAVYVLEFDNAVDMTLLDALCRQLKDHLDEDSLFI